MERGFVLLFAAVMVSLEPGVRGTAHLSFSNTQVNITRTGCGDTKLCVETPNSCDPAGNGTCLFVSVVASPLVAPNGANLSIELRGNSAGYVALGLTVNASEGTTNIFACAQNASNNGSFFFRTMHRNNTNNELSSHETRVTLIRGLVEGDVIRCEFDIPGVNATQMGSSHETTYTILLGTGNVTGNTLGPFMVSVNTGPLNLSDPTSNLPTTAPPTTAGASGALQSYGLLLLMSVLTLSVSQTKDVL